MGPFGIRLSAHADATQQVRHRVDGVLAMSKAMLGTLTSFYDRVHLEKQETCARTIFVDTMKVRATDFDLAPATQQQLYDNRRQAAERLLDGTDDGPGWDFDAYLRRFRRRPAPMDGRSADART